MNQLLLLCRPGYEKECAAEIQDQASDRQIFGFVQTKAQQGYVTYQCYQAEEADRLAKELPLSGLIFARQMMVTGPLLEQLPEQDRISPIVEALSSIQKAGELRVETPDNDDAKQLSKFCRKFTVPLRQALKKSGQLLHKENPKRPVIHVLFVASGQAFVGYSYTSNNSPYPMGILRLRQPSDAPSRSSLKLEEAFQVFIPQDEHDTRLTSGLNGVDLGACPGGWTYQLVRRGMMVAAVDHGSMAQTLMETGQVKHYAEDGFRFEPPRKNIYWLVCDMVDKPARVAQLIEEWALSGWFIEAIFNLKLPMKARYKEVTQVLETMDAVFKEQGFSGYQIQCKHLYHDRDEVTVHLDLRAMKRK
ncbi:23S rRNA (cytidine(2498)-2'-O)-methyltransferase RlmM [Paraferrimonas haliotis]|uniref:Ribosomal RNA large subunit methyltransferase M n=1 Tax=Paraferrimonas haliotis TaxID=2013866 RepID=A0AA37TKQ5_9GAMM|nr:23S rRNA (cytidine(2498)-2'-O)-methyltransferase RlmM [Paraferrimonas haliotis]GLS82964.1 ribosomal RNA large subunit methyltransferase M [Paraferrimonas haliotis]